MFCNRLVFLTIFFRYVRQSKKETLKEETLVQDKIQLINTLNELTFHIERQDAQLREMSRVVADLGKYLFDNEK